MRSSGRRQRGTGAEPAGEDPFRFADAGQFRRLLERRRASAEVLVEEIESGARGGVDLEELWDGLPRRQCALHGAGRGAARPSPASASATEVLDLAADPPRPRTGCSDPLRGQAGERLRPAAVTGLAGLLREQLSTGDAGRLAGRTPEARLELSYRASAARCAGPTRSSSALGACSRGRAELVEWAPESEHGGLALWLEASWARTGRMRQRHYLHVRDGRWSGTGSTRRAAQASRRRSEHGDTVRRRWGRRRAHRGLASTGWSGARLERGACSWTGAPLVAKRSRPESDWLGPRIGDRGREALL